MCARNQDYRKLLMGAQNCTITFLSAPWKLWSFYFQQGKMSWYIQRSIEFQYPITSIARVLGLRRRSLSRSWTNGKRESLTDVQQLQVGNDGVVPSPCIAWHKSFKSCRMLLVQPRLTKNCAHILCALSLPFAHLFKWWQQYIHKKSYPVEMGLKKLPYLWLKIVE